MTKAKNLTFGTALGFLKSNYRVAREGWNGKGMYIYLVQGSEIPVQDLRNEAMEQVGRYIDNPDQLIKINPHIDMKAADGSIVVGWLASQTDMLAEDWMVVL